MKKKKSTNRQHESRNLLGSKISDAIRLAKKIPDLVYNYKKGDFYIFKNAPFKTVFTQGDTITVIDEYKESRKEPRFNISGLLLAAPVGDKKYTIVGDLVNISYSSICIQPYIFPSETEQTWKLHIDVGHYDFDITGKISRMDKTNLVFKFNEITDELLRLLLNLNKVA